MKTVTIVVLGLSLWGLSLVWPEINTSLAGLNGWLIGGSLAIVIYLWLNQQLDRRRPVEQAILLNDGPEQDGIASLHSRPTRPIPVVPEQRRPSRPTRPVPTL